MRKILVILVLLTLVLSMTSRNITYDIDLSTNIKGIEMTSDNISKLSVRYLDNDIPVNLIGSEDGYIVQADFPDNSFVNINEFTSLLDIDAVSAFTISGEYNVTYTSANITSNSYIIVTSSNLITLNSISLNNVEHSFAISVDNSPNTTISASLISDFYNPDGDLVGISIVNSPNSTLSSNLIRNLKVDLGSKATGLLVDNSPNAYIYNTDVFTTNTNSKMNGTIVGMNITKSDNAYLKFSNVYNIFANQIIAYYLYNNENLTITQAYNSNLFTDESTLYAVQASKLTNAYFNGLTFDNIDSVSDTFDFGNSRSIYGYFIEGSDNIDIVNSNILNIDVGVDVNLMTFNNVNNLTLDNNDYTNVISNSLKVFDIKSSNNILIQSIVMDGLKATSFEGIKLDSNSGNITILKNTMTDIKATSLTRVVLISNTDNVYFFKNTIDSISTTSTTFGIYGMVVLDSYNTTLDGNTISSILSSANAAFGLYFSNSNLTSIISNTISDISTDLLSAIGIYILSSNSFIIENNTITSIISTASSLLSLEISALSSIDGYGLFIDSSNTITIKTNKFTSVSNWLALEGESTGVNTINNTIDSITSTLVSLNHPSDITYDIVNTFNPITWTATTNNVNSTSKYSIFLDNVLQVDGNWTSGVGVSYTPENLTLGTYIVKIIFTELNGFNTTDFVIINAIETTVPELISTAKNITMAIGIDRSLSWNAIDGNADSYSIFRNGTEIQFGEWVSNISVSIDLVNTPLGIWNFTILFRDTVANSISHTVWIKIVNPVDLTFIKTPISGSYELRDDYFISFTVSSVNGGNFTMSINGKPVLVAQWLPDDEFKINMADFIDSVGDWSITVVVVDEFLQTISFEIRLVVVSPPDEVTTSGFIDIGGLVDALDEPILKENLPIFLSIFGVLIIVGVWQRTKLKKATKAAAKKVKRKSKKSKKS